MQSESQKWIEDHPREIACLAGQWIVVHGKDGVVAHDKDPLNVIPIPDGCDPLNCTCQYVFPGSVFRVSFQRHLKPFVQEIAGEALLEIQEDEDSFWVALIQGDDTLKEKFRNSEHHGRGLSVLGLKDFDPDEPRVTFTFPDVESARQFKTWMCEIAEQDFYEWENAHIEGQGHIGFDYHDPGGCEITCRR
ncbi:MAG: hypothetical protein WC824_13880 [Bacteroidota bacterium]|jgi:hypothetical protein